MFAPCPVTRLLDCVGGVSCLFGLVAMSTTPEELYASLKALTTAVKSDKITSKHLNCTRSYQVICYAVSLILLVGLKTHRCVGAIIGEYPLKQ